MYSPSQISTSPTIKKIVTNDELTLIPYYHPEPTVYVRIHCWCTFYGLGKYIVTCIHMSSFTALKITCAFFIHPSFPSFVSFFFLQPPEQHIFSTCFLIYFLFVCVFSIITDLSYLKFKTVSSLLFIFCYKTDSI